MSRQNFVFFGEYIRELRISRNLPLRKVAADLDIDPSTLGKIERSSRKPPREIIEKLATIFNVDQIRLKTIYLSDKISMEVISEGLGTEVLTQASEKLDILKSKKKFN
jgi:transcriptional regulator with XRE-family HTH domain